MRGPILMSESSTHMLLPTASIVLPPHTENTRGSRLGPMNSVCRKWNMAPLLPAAVLQMFAISGSLQCLRETGSALQQHTCLDEMQVLLCPFAICCPVHTYVGPTPLEAVPSIMLFPQLTSCWWNQHHHLKLTHFSLLNCLSAPCFLLTCIFVSTDILFFLYLLFHFSLNLVFLYVI